MNPRSENIYSMFTVLVLAVLMPLAAAGPSDVLADQLQNSASLSVDPFYSSQGFGPYAVGRATLSYVDTSRDDRPIVIDVWYPTVVTPGASPSVYDLVFALLPSAVATADTPVASGEFPLVVFSHGSQGIRYQSFFLTEALASHGFIVAAPDHAGNTAADLIFDTTDPFEEVVIDRPQDISFVISRMLENDLNADSLFANRIDQLNIGVLGHSFGGYTTLAAASGIDGTVAADPRITALAPFAPASSILSDAQLGRIEQPTLIVGGTADITTPIDDQSSRPFELMELAERVRADIVDAGHQSFTNICDFSAVLLDAGIPDTLISFLLGNADEGCSPLLIPIDEAHRLTRLYIIAFFQRYLNFDMRYDLYLGSEFAVGKNLPVIVFNESP